MTGTIRNLKLSNLLLKKFLHTSENHKNYSRLSWHVKLIWKIL
jgi:hypothetical protein